MKIVGQGEATNAEIGIPLRRCHVIRDKLRGNRHESFVTYYVTLFSVGRSR